MWDRIDNIGGTGTPQYGLLHCTPPSWPFSSHIQFGLQGINLFLVILSAYVILNKKNDARIIRFADNEDHFLDPNRYPSIIKYNSSHPELCMVYLIQIGHIF